MLETYPLAETNLRWLQNFADAAARSIFSRLDNSLDPSLFLVAIPRNVLSKEISTTNQPSVIKGHINLNNTEDLNSSVLSEAFSHFRGIYPQIESEITKREAAVLDSPIDHYRDPFLTEEAIGITLEQSFKQIKAAEGRAYFCERAIWRDKTQRFICPVVSLNHKHYENHYTLKKPITFNEKSTSLLNLSINQFLEACFLSLRDEDADAEPFNQRARNVLVDSARAIMSFYNLRQTVSPLTDNMRLFDDCNSIAALAYEKREGYGSLIIAKKNHPEILVKVGFAQPIPVGNHRLARKALEMTGGQLSLLCDVNRLYGLGSVGDRYDPAGEDLFKIEFLGSNSWRLSHNNNDMMSVVLGQPKLPTKPISSEEFQEKFRQQFKDASNVDSIYSLVEAATKQPHGALIIISDQAVPETQRFAGQCVQVYPFQATIDNIIQLTAIDGAVHQISSQRFLQIVNGRRSDEAFDFNGESGPILFGG